jgi:hypothetical protein
MDKIKYLCSDSFLPYIFFSCALGKDPKLFFIAWLSYHSNKATTYCESYLNEMQISSHHFPSLDPSMLPIVLRLLANSPSPVQDLVYKLLPPSYCSFPNY